MLEPLYFLNRQVGHIDKEKKVYVSYRNESQIFRKFNGLGISYGVLKRLKELNINKIIILLERENNDIEKYETTTIRFINAQITYSDKLDNQKILSFLELKSEALTVY